MPASWVQEVAGVVQTGSFNSMTVTANGSTTEGNLLVCVAVSNLTSLQTHTFSDSKSNTWTKSVEMYSSAGPLLAVGWCIVGSGKAHTIGVDSFTTHSAAASNGRTMLVIEFTDLLASPFDQSNYRAGTNAATFDSDTITTTAADELLVGCFGTSHVLVGNVFNPGSGYTIVSQRTSSRVMEAMVEFQVVSSTGTYVAGTSFDVSAAGWIASVLSFKGTAGSAPATGQHLLTSTGVGQ